MFGRSVERYQLYTASTDTGESFGACSTIYRAASFHHSRSLERLQPATHYPWRHPTPRIGSSEDLGCRQRRSSGLWKQDLCYLESKRTYDPPQDQSIKAVSTFSNVRKNIGIDINSTFI